MRVMSTVGVRDSTVHSAKPLCKTNSNQAKFKFQTSLELQKLMQVESMRSFLTVLDESTQLAQTKEDS